MSSMILLGHVALLSASCVYATASVFPHEWLEHSTESELRLSEERAKVWQEETKEMFRFAWDEYRLHAFGEDEINPTTGGPAGKGRDQGHLATTLVDSLDTLWLMGLHDDFDAAELRLKEIDFGKASGKKVSFFETTIRILGGLLGAYSLSGRPSLLAKAEDIGRRLLPAFGVYPRTGYPSNVINLGNGETARLKDVRLAEVGTFQLEFRCLSHLTGDVRYKNLAETAERSIFKAGHFSKMTGLIPAELRANEFSSGEHTFVNMGSLSDSYYEYLLKMHLQTNQTEIEWKTEWIHAMDEMFKQLYLTTKSGISFLSESITNQHHNQSMFSLRMDHLACFVPGMIFEGSRRLPRGEIPQDWEEKAKALMNTCHLMYSEEPTGLAADVVTFPSQADDKSKKPFKVEDAAFKLRPETVESLYYLWYHTGESKYREWGHDILVAMNKTTRTTHGFSSLLNVEAMDSPKIGVTESFFFAETMKYFYLLFSPRDTLDHSKFVLNTEAHPLPIWHEQASVPAKRTSEISMLQGRSQLRGRRGQQSL